MDLKKVLAEEITKMRLKHAKDVKAGMIVTTCPMCFSCFDQVNKGKIKSVELSTLLVNNII